MKLNLIKPDELVDLVDCENVDDEAEFINRLIEEKLEHNQCIIDASEPKLYSVADLRFKTSDGKKFTHYIWHITKPIEPEKVECNHTYITTTGSRTFPHQTDFCPDCGAKLS